ncbi:hydroxyisourate hydrolase [Rufibacter latericius]|uniref:5-hydroxyisourate hydrolase n=1 Tax=Rufibacter latericius TaxID=2487040 RepID=A0A3M9MCZ9_9BACT|nr:hydroxyisourate hydrolase [Rufibacter latericius]RNI23426.1 hydroxyisourate hydrolase [Rufibacter latericius]
MKKILFSFLLSVLTTMTFAQTQTHQLSSHILDISTGKPAVGVPVKLEKLNEQTKTWSQVEVKTTDGNGRIKDFLDYQKSEKGIYRLTFLVADYFKAQKVDSFYPFIEVVFQIKDKDHYHVPITLSPYGYSTYRGN